MTVGGVLVFTEFQFQSHFFSSDEECLLKVCKVIFPQNSAMLKTKTSWWKYNYRNSFPRKVLNHCFTLCNFIVSEIFYHWKCRCLSTTRCSTRFIFSRASGTGWTGSCVVLCLFKENYSQTKLFGSEQSHVPGCCPASSVNNSFHVFLHTHYTEVFSGQEPLPVSI